MSNQYLGRDDDTGVDTDANHDGSKLTIRCEKHPTYRALRKPACDCQACFQLYWMLRIF